MRNWCATIAALVLAATSAPAQDSKLGAEAKAAQRLAELLKPGAAADPAVSAPLSRSGPAFVEKPEMHLSAFRGALPHLPLPSSSASGMRHPPEGPPLARYRAALQTPEALELATLPPIHVPSVDVKQPLSLPILARPQSDRASLADPTLEASVAAALAKISAERAGPLPFTPLNLPDPFEHAQAVRLGHTPQELPVPPPLTPKTPR
jgi:hypothetical protein